MQPFALKNALEQVREKTPLIHCITNYVTVNDCANALLACGGSPIMSDEPDDVSDITSICGGLVLNIGTLNTRSIEAMMIAGKQAAALGHLMVLDPVGAGASALRTRTASALLDTLPISLIRGNMSEMRALAGAAAATRGVDVNPADVVTKENIVESAAFACKLAASSRSLVAITGALDIVADAHRAYVISNGVALMGKITGAGCMLSCVTAAYMVANPDYLLDAVVAAVAGMGLAGEQAAQRMGRQDGNGSFRTYLLDALCNMTGDVLHAGARVEKIV